MVITPEPRAEFRLAEIPGAVRGAGFVPAEMTLRARGTYVVEDAEIAFRIRGWSDAIPVRARPPLPGGETLLRARVDYSGARPVLEPMP